MAKMKLDLEDLQVETFAVMPDGEVPFGTVHAFAAAVGDAAAEPATGPSCPEGTCWGATCDQQTCQFNTCAGPSCEHTRCYQTCPGTCPYTCDDASCMRTCGDTCWVSWCICYVSMDNYTCTIA